MTTGGRCGSLNCMLQLKLFGLMGIMAITACAPARRNTASPPDSVGIIPGLQAAFAAVNPRIDRIRIQQLATTEPWPTHHGEYAIVAMGLETRAVPNVPGSAFGLGQLFGVFVVDSAFMRVDHVLYVFPTRRWLDYYVKFGEVDSDSITVLGEGDTYGDERMGWKFDWSGNGRHEVAWPTETHSKAMNED